VDSYKDCGQGEGGEVGYFWCKMGIGRIFLSQYCTYVTVTPSPTPSKEVHTQTSIPSAPTTLVASTIRYTPLQEIAPQEPIPERLWARSPAVKM